MPTAACSPWVAWRTRSGARPLLDPRLWKCADAIQDFGTTVRSVRNQKFRTLPEQQKAFSRIMEKAQAADAQFEKLRTDQALIEEMEGR